VTSLQGPVFIGQRLVERGREEREEESWERQDVRETAE